MEIKFPLDTVSSDSPPQLHASDCGFCWVCALFKLGAAVQRHLYLDLLLSFLAHFALAQQFGLVGVLVSLQVLPMTFNVRPGPRV